MDYCTTLRLDRFRAWCNARGYTVATFADDIGTAPTSIYRVIRGDTHPSGGFIAGCAVIFGENCLPDIFEFTNTDERARKTDGDTFAPTRRRRELDRDPQLGTKA